MTLIAAYKTLGGSFTGDLTVDPGHLREQRRNAREDATNPDPESSIAERRRRTRDAVEAALSDVILLGTEEQVLMATQVANDMVAGRSVETAALVASLRDFIRQALDLDPVPAGLAIPAQGPLRVTVSGGGGPSPSRRARRRSRASSGSGAPSWLSTRWPPTRSASARRARHSPHTSRCAAVTAANASARAPAENASRVGGSGWWLGIMMGWPPGRPSGGRKRGARWI